MIAIEALFPPWESGQANRHLPDTIASRVEHSVGDRRGNRDNRCLPSADRRQVRAVEQVDFQLRHIGETRNLVLAE